jgi:hypothetical protein
MATIDSLGMAVHVRPFRHSGSGSNWSLIVNSGGVDVLHAQFMVSPPFGQTWVTVPDFGPEGFAGVYGLGNFPFGPLGPMGTLEVDTTPLDPSSIRLELRGDDLLRPLHILSWGIEAGGAIVPLTVDTDLAINLSGDLDEGVGSMPLALVDSGTDATPLSEVVVFVSLTGNPNAPTRQPVSLRVERANGNLIWASGLEDFFALDSGGRNAKIWRLTDVSAFSRVDTLGPVIPKLRVDGPDNAMIQSLVAIGVNRDGPRPVAVPLVHHVPSLTGDNPWVGTSTSPDGREMILPLCATGAR